MGRRREPPPPVAGEMPAYERVLFELQVLSWYSGLEYSRMNQAIGLMNLAVVANELARLGRRITDRPAVAHDVLICVAENERLLGSQDATVLKHTLNLARQKPSTLTDRRGNAMEALDLYGKAYERAEMDAYAQLAGVLLRISKSPCAEEDRDAEADAKVAGQRFVTYDEQARLLLQIALMGLRTSRTHEEATKAAHEILELLPQGRHYADAVYFGDEAEKVIRLVIDAVHVYYRAWARTLDAGGAPYPYAPHPLVDYYQLRSQGWDRSEVQVLSSVNRPYGTHRRPRLTVEGLDIANTVIDRIFLALEATNDWESLGAAPGNASRVQAPDPIEPAPILTH